MVGQANQFTGAGSRSAGSLRDSREDAARIDLAEECLRSKDLFTREAGAQMVAEVDSPEALRLLEKACQDTQERVAEGGLRGLLQAYARGAPEAEETLLRVIAQNNGSFRVRSLLQKEKPEAIGGQLKSSDETVRRARFLAANPELTRCRLMSLQSGSAMKVQSYRSGRLRANPSFAAFFDVVRADPDLRRSLTTMLVRCDEFIHGDSPSQLQTRANGPKTPLTLEPFWTETRRMTGLLAAIGMDPTLSALANLMIDRTMRRQSDALWNRLKASGPLAYVPEVVVGSGPHSANFCSTIATLRPDQPPLVIEQRDRIGGQFAAPDAAAWILNSRSRPTPPDRRSIPGTMAALNSLGPYAPVQEADITGQSFATQDRLALAIRMSLFLSCQALVGTSFVRWIRNSEEDLKRAGIRPLPGSAAGGRYLVQVEKPDTGETAYLLTDAIISAGGLGESKSAFRRSRRPTPEGVSGEGTTASQAALSTTSTLTLQQYVPPGTPGASLPRYLTFCAFMERLAERDDPFPLRGIRRAIVVGAGDSARVAVEALLGYGPAAGRTTQTLDRVQQVVWIGQTAKTREEFLACQRPRYFWLALEFPRGSNTSDSDSNASTKSPSGATTLVGALAAGPRIVSPATASRIRPVNDRAVTFGADDNQCVVITAKDDTYIGDIVIDCSGFGSTDPDRRTPPRPLSDIKRALRPGSRLRVCDALDAKIDLVITCREAVPIEKGSLSRRFSGTVQEYSGQVAIFAPVAFSTGFCLPADTGVELEKAIRAAFKRAEDMPLYLKKTVLPPMYATVNGEVRAIARREFNEQVFYIGPQAGLPALSEGMNGDPASGALPPPARVEEAVSLWRYAEVVTAFAENYFANRPSPVSRGSRPVPLLPEFKPQDLRFGGGGGSPPAASDSPATVTGIQQSIHALAPETIARARSLSLQMGAMGTERLLRYVLSEHLRSFRLPPDIDRRRERAGIGPRVLQFRLMPQEVMAAARSNQQSPEQASLKVEWRNPALKGITLKPVAEAICADPIVQAILFSWNFPTHASERRCARMTIVKVSIYLGRLSLQDVGRG